MAVVLSSCSSYKALDIEVLSPSEYQIPKGVKRITLLNNSKEQATDQGHYTYKHNITTAYKTRKKLISKDRITVDSTCTNALYSMSNQLKASMLFDEIKLGRKEALPEITAHNIDEILNAQGTEALLVLESLNYEDKLSHLHYSYYDVTEKELEVSTRSVWLLYYQNKINPPYRFIVTDTVYWNQEEIDRPACITEAVWQNSEKAAKKITPYWITVNRLYHSDISLLYHTVDENIKKGDWDAAAALWMQVYNGEKKESMKKARMAYNMALFFEIKNDLNTALEWLENSIVIFKKHEAQSELKVCALYSDILKRRISLNEKLNQQFLGN